MIIRSTLRVAIASFVALFATVSVAQPPLALEGHADAVTSTAFSPDGQLAVTGSYDRTINIFQSADGALLRTLAGHTGQVYSVSVSPTGRQLISGSRDGTAKLWDLYVPTPLAAWPGHEAAVGVVEVASDGKWVVSGSADGALRIVQPTDGSMLFNLVGHTVGVTRAAINADNTQLASGDAAGNVYLWNPLDGKPLAALGASPAEITGVAYHPGGTQLLTSAADGAVKRWTLPIVAPVEISNQEGPLAASVIAADGKLIALATADGKVFVKVVAAETPPTALAGELTSATRLALSTDATLLAAASKEGVIKLWNTADGADRLSLRGHVGAVHDVTFNADATQIASAGEDGTIRFWRPPVAATTLAGHTMPVGSVAATADGKLIASAGADGKVLLFNSDDGTAAGAVEGHTENVTDITFTADATQIASADATGMIQLTTVADNKAVGRMHGPAGEVSGLAYLPDGKVLLSASKAGTLTWWQSPPTAAVPLAGHTAEVTQMAVTPGEESIVTGSSDGTLLRFKSADGSAEQPLTGHTGPVTALAAGKGGVVAGSESGMINTWNLTDGKQGLALAGHDSVVTALAVHPTGESLASAGDDGVIRFWRMPTPATPLAGAAMTATMTVFNADRSLMASAGTVSGKPAVVVRGTADGKAKGTLLGHTAAVTAIAFSADSKRIVTGSTDKSSRVWDLTDPKFPEIASFTEHAAGVTAAAFNADATQVFAGEATGAIKQWTIADLAEVRSLTGHTAAVTAIQLAGTTLVSGSADQTVRTWNAASGAAGKNLSHGAAVTAVAVSADSKQIASGGADKQVKLFPIAGGAATATLTGCTTPITAISFDATGTRVVASSSDSIRLWNTAGLPLERFPAGDMPPLGVAFAAASETVLIADAGHVLHAQPISLVAAISGHEGAVSGLEYSPDGLHLFSAGADAKVQRWNVADGKLLGSFAAATDAVADLDLSVDGKRLVAASADKNIYAWPVAAPATAPVAADATFTLATAATAVSAGSDGSRIAVGDAANLISVFDLASGQMLERLPRHDMPVADVALVAENATVVSVSADKTAAIHKLSATRVLAIAEGGVNDLSLSADGTLAATAGADGKIKLIDPADGTIVHEVTPPAAPISLALRGDKAQLATALADMQLAIYPIAAQGPGEAILVPQEVAIAKVGYHETSGKLAVAAAGAVRVYDSATQRLLEEWPLAEAAVDVTLLADGMSLAAASGNAALVQPLSLTQWIAAHEAAATGIALTPDGTAAISGGVDKKIQQWNLTDGSLMRTYGAPADVVVSIDLSTDGKLLAAAIADNNLLLFDAVTAPAANQPAEPTTTIELPEAVAQLSVAADGSRLATAGADGVVRVWESASGRELQRFTGHEGAVATVSITADGKSLVSAGADGSCRLWSVAAEQLVVADETRVGDIAYVGDGTQFATAGNEMTVKFWAADGSVAKQLAGANGALSRMAINATATQLAAADVNGNVLLWNLADGALATTIEAAAIVNELAYSADGLKLAAAGADNHLRVYLGEGGTLLQDQTATAPLLAVTFDPAGHELLTGSADNGIRTWAYAAPTPIAELTGHTGAVYTTAYSPDGLQAATGGADGTVRLWDTTTGAAVRSLTGHTGAVYSVRFVAEGKQLLTAGIDGTARLFDATSGQVVRSFAPTVEEGQTLPPLFDATLNTQGTLVATGGSEKVIRTYNAANGQPAQVLEGHADAVYRLEFKGASLLSVGHAGNLHSWNPTNGQQAATAKLPAVTFSLSATADGTKGVVGGADGKAYVIDLP